MQRKDFLLATPALLGLAVGGSWLTGCTPPQTEGSAPENGTEAETAIEPEIMTAPEIGRSSVAYDAAAAVATLNVAAGNLRILQITDLHFFNKNPEAKVFNEADEKTVADLYSYVTIYKPDLVMVTGDLWHDNPDGHGFSMMQQAMGAVSSLGVPFGYTWGNHDQMDEPQAGHDFIAGLPNSIYRGAATHGDYRIRIVDTREGERFAGTLFCMNTNRYGLTRWQLDWLAQASAELRETNTPALAFFHIPLLEQKTFYDKNLIPGVQGEEVCNEKEMGRALPALADCPIKATFCGHDHVNDYTVNAQGVDLVYGRATGYSGYGGDSVRKGAKIIDWNLDDGAYRAQTVFADGTQWIPTHSS